MYLLDSVSGSEPACAVCLGFSPGNLAATPQLIAHSESLDGLVPVYRLVLRTLGAVFCMCLAMVEQDTGSAPLPAQIRALASRQW